MTEYTGRPFKDVYDSALGKITDQDREYAKDCWEDLQEVPTSVGSAIETIAVWFRKVRYEAVMKDRNGC
jgi:hypothetical protein